MTAGATAGISSQSADLLTDLKSGYVLGGKPRQQYFAQFLGIIAGAIFCLLVFNVLGLVEYYFPRAARYLPSPVGLGIALVVPFSNALMMFLGALGA